MPSNQKLLNYPKSHLLAASGVAALLSLALLVFPSREVEAKKTSSTSAPSPGQIIAEPDTTAQSPADSPFAYASDMQTSEQASSDEGKPEDQTGEPVAETDPLAKA